MSARAILTILTSWLIALGQFAQGHDGDHPPNMRLWKDVDGLFELDGTFVMQREGRVQILKHDGGTVAIPLSKLSVADRQWIDARVEQIRFINEPISGAPVHLPGAAVRQETFNPLVAIVVVLGLVVGSVAACWYRRRGLPFEVMLVAVAIGSFPVYALAQGKVEKPTIQSHFKPFEKKLQFRSDEKYFYVESNGMPDHPMMVGIKAWQQQVPIPQAYTGRNAWAIPLQPKMAEKPISAKKALFRGAIALAVNGVPIFNPIKNDGRTDTFLAGELDEYGGHCGRGDDYHYHIGPAHLQKIVGPGQPIGYALDGYPLYGYLDNDGKEPQGLDEFNGRLEKEGYRYYSTKKYPYVNGGLRGVVTVNDDQIEPQPRAVSPRAALPPLRGATITDFKRDDAKRTVTVIYSLNGKAHAVNYRINEDGCYRFTFTDGDGNEKSEDYRARQLKDGPKKDRPGAKKEEPPKKEELPKKDTMLKKDSPPKKDAVSPRMPWIAAHFDELDIDKDGWLTLDELKKEIDKAFNGFDANRDGQLTKAEYEGKGANVKSTLAGFIKGHAAEFSDKEGTISKAALTELLSKMFQRIDRSGTGKISKEQATQSVPKKPE